MSRHSACPPHAPVKGYCRKCGAKKPLFWPHYLLLTALVAVVVANAVIVRSW